MPLPGSGFSTLYPDIHSRIHDTLHTVMSKPDKNHDSMREPRRAGKEIPCRVTAPADGIACLPRHFDPRASYKGSRNEGRHVDCCCVSFLAALCTQGFCVNRENSLERLCMQLLLCSTYQHRRSKVSEDSNFPNPGKQIVLSPRRPSPALVSEWREEREERQEGDHKQAVQRPVSPPTMKSLVQVA